MIIIVFLQHGDSFELGSRDCPITYVIFRDSVIAIDGHVYKRGAIIRWILQNGTSPFTRAPLQIDDLKPDEHLRCLATQRRTSTVSYNTHLNTVTQPHLQPTITQISQRAMVDDRSKTSYCKRCPMIIFFILAILFAVGLTGFAVSMA